MRDRLRVAMLCHSTNPRGGVEHAMSLGEALHDFGHKVTIIAPDAAGLGFSRIPRCQTLPFPAEKVNGDLNALVARRSVEYAELLGDIAVDFDVIHAHDSLSGSCVADFAANDFALPYIRTVHHLDHFPDADLAARQARSVVAADQIVCVSNMIADEVRDQFNRTAVVIGNGVDTARFNTTPGRRDTIWKQRLNHNSPCFLAVGGIEARKNSLRLVQAFAAVHARLPAAGLTIVGGASLLDHSHERCAFDNFISAAGPCLACAIDLVGVVDDADLPALYRAADALIFPSLREGFGLVTLEAMACGTPVVVSHIAPFTEYLSEDDVVWCDPFDVQSIAVAMQHAITAPSVSERGSRGRAVAARHTWSDAASRHLELYAQIFNGVSPCPR